MTLHQAHYILYIINVKLRYKRKVLKNILQDFMGNIYIQRRQICQNRQRDRQTDKRMDRRTYRPTNRWTDGQTNRRTDRPSDRRKDGKTNRPTDG